MIPLSVPFIKGKAWNYVKDCLDTGWVSSVGSYVKRFEEAIAQEGGRPYAVACVNGTSALHTALMTAGITAGDEVIMPALTFAAPAFAVSYCGAYPVFMDVEKQYWQIDVNKLESFLRNHCDYRRRQLYNRTTKRPVKAVIAVHLLGHPADMMPIMALARKYNLVVIEDAAESIGASYKGRKVGGIGHIGCFSFNGNKIMTAGGGGMMVTDNKSWAKRAKYLTTQSKDDELEYIHHEVGYNYRLCNIQAALGLSQLEQLGGFIAAKKRISMRYARGLKDIQGLTLPQLAPWADAYTWLYTVLIDNKIFSRNSRQLLTYLEQQGIQTRPLWRPLHLLKPYQKCLTYQVSVAVDLYQRALSLPSSVNLSPKDQCRVIDAIQKGLR